MNKNDPHYVANEIRKSINEEIKRKKDIEDAILSSAKQNWAQKHWVWWTIIVSLIGGITGFLFSYILEFLKQNQLMGL